MVSGVVAPAASIARARSMAVSSRLPPPTLPQVRSVPTTILAPASRGACPRTVTTVIRTPGTPSARSCATALSQSMSGVLSVEGVDRVGSVQSAPAPAWAGSWAWWVRADSSAQ